jgi:UDP-glucose 4-epimerase
VRSRHRHRGHVGGPVADHLERLSHEAISFDRADGMDLLNLAHVRRAATGCAAVVHLAALAHDTAGSPKQIMAVNALGTWHVLLAAGYTEVERRAEDGYQRIYMEKRLRG